MTYIVQVQVQTERMTERNGLPRKGMNKDNNKYDTV